MIGKEFENVTMSAMDWFALMNQHMGHCQVCGGFSPSAKEAPLDTSFFFTMNESNDKLWYFAPLPRIYGRGEVPKTFRICHDCLVRANNYKEQAILKKQEEEKKRKEWLNSEQYRHNMVLENAKNLSGGFVYICRLAERQDVYKIGATASWKGLRQRVRSQKILHKSGLVCVINTCSPFETEKRLHRKFARLNVKELNGKEYFRLNDDSFDFVYNLEEINQKRVGVISAKDYLAEVTP